MYILGSGADSAHNLLELGEEQSEPGKSNEYAIIVRSLRRKVAWDTRIVLLDGSRRPAVALNKRPRTLSASDDAR